MQIGVLLNNELGIVCDQSHYTLFRWRNYQIWTVPLSATLEIEQLLDPISYLLQDYEKSILQKRTMGFLTFHEVETFYLYDDSIDNRFKQLNKLKYENKIPQGLEDVANNLVVMNDDFTDRIVMKAPTLDSAVTCALKIYHSDLL